LAAPLERDDDQSRSVFIFHDAIHREGIRAQLAQYFAAQMSNLNADEFLSAANELGDKQKHITLNYIAPSLPIFINKIIMGENRDDGSDGKQKF